jgi:hypothetical protein
MKAMLRPDGLATGSRPRSGGSPARVTGVIAAYESVVDPARQIVNGYMRLLESLARSEPVNPSHAVMIDACHAAYLSSRALAKQRTRAHETAHARGRRKAFTVIDGGGQ